MNVLNKCDQWPWTFRDTPLIRSFRICTLATSVKTKTEVSLTLRKMAALQRITRCFVQKNLFLCTTKSLIKQTRCCTVVAGSTQHTLSVRKRIERTREAALLGGGLKRIDKQHKKVSTSISCIAKSVDCHDILFRFPMSATKLFCLRLAENDKQKWFS